MTAKEELNQYKYARKRVDEALEEYEKYKTRAEKMTSIITGMPNGTKGSDKVADNATMMADLSREYEKRWMVAERHKLEIEDRINSIEEPYRTILYKRYIEEKGFEEIAVEMSYSYDWTTHLHGEALKQYEKTTNENKTKQE